MGDLKRNRGVQAASQAQQPTSVRQVGEQSVGSGGTEDKRRGSFLHRKRTREASVQCCQKVAVAAGNPRWGKLSNHLSAPTTSQWKFTHLQYHNERVEQQDDVPGKATSSTPTAVWEWPENRCRAGPRPPAGRSGTRSGLFTLFQTDRHIGCAVGGSHSVGHLALDHGPFDRGPVGRVQPEGHIPVGGPCRTQENPPAVAL